MDRLKMFLKANGSALLLILAYLFLLAPYSLNFVFYMPDEHHYVDAAIHMLKHGEYLSPHNPDGGYRFLKPIFTYWAVLLSYLVFGVSEMSSRLPVWAAAGMVLWMTYRVTLLAFRQKDIALLSMLIVGATPILHRSTAIAITDLFLLVFLQLMLWGVTGLLVSKTTEKRFLWALYLGAGFAVMSKGLPAVAFLLVALFFLLVNPWKRFRIREIVYLPAVVAGLILGGFWYVAVYVKHGPGALGSFLHDQVGMRVTEKLGLMVANFVQAIVIVVLIMFPFALPAWRSLLYRHHKITNSNATQSILAFSLLWVIAMIGMASFVSKFYYRYLLPVIPVMAMAMAYFITLNKDKKGTRRFLRAAIIVAYSLFVLVNIAGVVSILLFWGPRWFYVVFAANIAVASWFFFRMINGTVAQQARLPFFFMAGLFWSLFFVISPISKPGLGPQLVAELKQQNIDFRQNIHFYGKRRSASRLRVASQGELDFKAYKPFERPVEPNDEVLIVADSYIDSLALDGFQLNIGSVVWDAIELEKLLNVKSKKELQELKLKNASIYYICVKQEE